MKKTLYEFRKGKEMHASGSWELNESEKRIIHVTGGLFAACGILAIISIVTPFWYLSGLFFTLTFVFAFAMGGSMFYLVWKKNKEKPIEKTYTEVDYTYNGITGEVRDNSREITKDEFHSRQN